jgi:SAM-dependent methyltransferase
MTADEERRRIEAVYTRYDRDPAELAKRDLASAGLQFIRKERDEALQNALAAADMLPLGGRKILDVGCGSGSALEAVVMLGADPRKCFGIDLLESRVAAARASQPAMTFVQGDARMLPWRDGEFDLVMANLLFSSILDGEIAAAVAAELRRATAVGGLILVYDNRYPSPFNSDVRAYGRARLRSLFPEAEIHLHALTPLPPLARWLGRRRPILLRRLAAVRILKARYLASIRPNPRVGAVGDDATKYATEWGLGC